MNISARIRPVDALYSGQTGNSLTNTLAPVERAQPGDTVGIELAFSKYGFGGKYTKPHCLLQKSDDGTFHRVPAGNLQIFADQVAEDEVFNELADHVMGICRMISQNSLTTETLNIQIFRGAVFLSPKASSELCQIRTPFHISRCLKFLMAWEESAHFRMSAAALTKPILKAWTTQHAPEELAEYASISFPNS